MAGAGVGGAVLGGIAGAALSRLAYPHPKKGHHKVCSGTTQLSVVTLDWHAGRAGVAGKAGEAWEAQEAEEGQEGEEGPQALLVLFFVIQLFLLLLFQLLIWLLSQPCPSLLSHVICHVIS